MQLTITTAGRTVTIACGALLLDMDGTLVDSQVCVERKWRDWCRRHGLDVDELLRVSHGLQLADTVRLMAPHLDLAAEVADLARREEQDTDGLRPVAGAARLLAALPPRRWAVVTSAWHRLAEIRLRHLGLPAPRVLVTADDTAHGKPAPDGYLMAAARLGCPPADCVVVEDSPAGIESGRAAGMRVIAVATTFAREELEALKADWAVDDLTGVTVRDPVAAG
ncbi:HAD-IA family hydrolase [Micromonospora sp. NPDC002411]